MNQDKFVSASSIRRSITTLVKAGYINVISVSEDENKTFMTMYIPNDLIQRKKKLKK